MERGTIKMFSIKEVANSLQISTQAIYKQKAELIDRGFLIKNNNNQWEITDNGFNYLQDKKINFIQQHTNKIISPVANQEEKNGNENTKMGAKIQDYISNDEVANMVINHYKDELQNVTNRYSKELQDMTERKDYFKAQFEELQKVHNQYLLPPTKNKTEEESKENKKQGFFSRFFKG